MRIEVAGLPAPQGSKRHVGGGRMVESSRAVGPWREAVRAETQRARKVAGASDDDLEWLPAFDAEVPVAVDIAFRLPRPRSHYGTGRNAGRLRPSAPRWPAGRPDADKLARAVLDGLQSGGAFADDGQVVHLSAVKLFADDYGPGCLIFVSEMEA